MLGRHGIANINVVVGGGAHQNTDIDEGQILRFVSARYRSPGRQVQSPKSGSPSSSTPYTPLCLLLFREGDSVDIVQRCGNHVRHAIPSQAVMLHVQIGLVAVELRTGTPLRCIVFNSVRNV